jgi:hypothetical protein
MAKSDIPVLAGRLDGAGLKEQIFRLKTGTSELIQVC